jgi:hypothetical protein
MASTENSDGKPIPADSPLYFLIRHIFLPPKLPNANTNSTAKERELLGTVHDALTQFRPFLYAEQTLMLDRCIRMLKCMMDARSGVGTMLKIDVFQQQIEDLAENGMVSFPTQNADI